MKKTNKIFCFLLLFLFQGTSLCFASSDNKKEEMCSLLKEKFSGKVTAWDAYVNVLMSAQVDPDKKEGLKKNINQTTSSEKRKEELERLYNDTSIICSEKISDLIKDKIVEMYPDAFEIKTGPGGFVYPLNFVDTPKNREKVIQYIEYVVKQQYCDNPMLSSLCNPSNLRMMEKENLKDFKYLTKAKNVSALNQAVDNYCSIGMCDYKTIKTMYDQYNHASGDKLRW